MKINSYIKGAKIKYDGLSIVAKSSIWFVFCSVLQKGISFITMPIFTRIMETDQYGLYTTYQSWLSIFIVFCTMNIHSCSYINAVSKSDTEEEGDRLGLSYLSLTFIITLGFLGAYLMLSNTLNPVIGMTTPLMVLMFVEILFLSPVNFWVVKQRYNYKYIKFVIVTIVMTLLNAGLGLFFVILAPAQQQGLARVGSIVLVQVLMGGIFYIYYVRRAHSLFLARDWRHALRIQTPLILHGLSLTVLASSDRIMINSMIGASAAAIYGVAYSIGMLTKVFKDSIVEAVRPWIYKTIKAQKTQDIEKNVRLITVFIAVVAFAIMIMGPEIILVMGGKKYQAAVNVIPPVIASTFFMFLYSIFEIFEVYFEQVNKAMIASAVGAVLNIALNYLLIPIYGYVAAGYTTLICYMLFCIAHYLILRYICNTKLKTATVISARFVIGISVIVLIMLGISQMLYQTTMVRYVIIAGIMLGIILNRKKLVSEFKRLRARGSEEQ